jgi:DNA-binding beta-propeller fold protein YncE
VYVADSGNNRVEKFDSSGNYVSQFGSSGSGNGQLNNPYGRVSLVL